MEQDEQEIFEYLKCFPDQFVSAREVCRRAGGKWRFRQDPDWALQVLLRMADRGIVEKDESGHYRLAVGLRARDGKDKYSWIPPHVRKILATDNPGLAQVFELEDPDAINDIPPDFSQSPA